METPRIDVEGVADAIRRGERVVFLDTRSPAAYEAATEQIPGSIRSTADAVSVRADELPPGALVVAYCT